jgi:hypothetical protein
MKPIKQRDDLRDALKAMPPALSTFPDHMAEWAFNYYAAIKHALTIAAQLQEGKLK